MADARAYPGIPGWVKLLGLIALIVVALFVVRHFAGGGPGASGPGEPPGGAGEHRAPEGGLR